MRILLLNHYAGSPVHGMEFRPFYLAREWVRLGCQAQIEAATFSHLRQANPAASRHVEMIDGVRYSWWPTPTYFGNGIGRVSNILSFTSQLARHATGIANAFRPDLVIASSTYPFDIFPARRIAAASGAMLAFEVHDLWPLTPVELGGMSPMHPFVVACDYAERFAYRHADAVVSMLPAAEPHMRDRGLAPGKFHYVPNGVDASEWLRQDAPVPTEHLAACAALREQGRFIVGYAGSHGLANALDDLIDAADLLRNDPVAIVLVGHGPEKDRLRDRARDLGLQNVIFLPPVPKACIPLLLDGMDVLYLGWLLRDIYRFGISPNKILDYMMAARPIIHAVAAGNDPVAEADCGLSVPPQQPAAVADAVRRMVRLDGARLSAMGENGRRFVREHHDYRVLARRFLDCAARGPAK
jgi:glycosyltransferase involved in cell wall biosynthesis